MKSMFLLLGIATVVSTPSSAQTRDQMRAIEHRTGVTKENACFLLALDLTPCDDAPAKPKQKAPEKK